MLCALFSGRKTDTRWLYIGNSCVVCTVFRWTKANTRWLLYTWCTVTCFQVDRGKQQVTWYRWLYLMCLKPCWHVLTTSRWCCTGGNTWCDLWTFSCGQKQTAGGIRQVMIPVVLFAPLTGRQRETAGDCPGRVFAAWPQHQNPALPWAGFQCVCI